MAASPRPALAGSERERAILSLSEQINLIVDRIERGTQLNRSQVEELKAQAWLGAIEAVDKFDPKRGFQLRTFSEHVIRGRIADWQRSQDWVPRSLRRRIKAGEAEAPKIIPIDLPDGLQGPRREFVGFDGRDLERDLVIRLTAEKLIEIARLTPREKRVIQLYYGQDLSLAAIGRRIGLSEPGVHKERGKALQKLRRAALFRLQSSEVS